MLKDILTERNVEGRFEIMNNYLVSIVVPIYNAQFFLKECLGSIKKQTYRNIEVLMIDDGSTDSSSRIATDFIKEDKRFKYFYKINGGLSSARNFGIKIAKGDYICFVDSDDYVSPSFISDMIVNIDSSIDIVFSGILRVDIDGNELCNDFNFPSKIITKEDLLLNASLDNGYQFICAVNRLYKKTVFDFVTFVDGKIHEDELFFNEMIQKDFNYKVVQSINYFYRQTDGSIMRSRLDARRLTAVDALLERAKIASAIGLRALRGRFYYLAACVLLQCFIYVDSYKNVCKFVRYFAKVYHPFLIRSCSYKLPYWLFVNLLKNVRLTMGVALIKRKAKLSTKQFGKSIFMMGTPVHGNLGDQAIVIAEERFLFCNGFSKKQIIEVDNEILIHRFHDIKAVVKPIDLLVIDGGGNLGTLWAEEDKKIAKIISTFFLNTVIVFPQSCFYESKSKFSEILQINNTILYSKNPNVSFFLRDLNSYKLFTLLYPQQDAALCPDIVLFTPRKKSMKKKKIIYVCKRSDKESTGVFPDVSTIDALLDFKFKIRFIDTVVKKRIGAFNRRHIVGWLLKKLSNASFVITDRLHGAIFSFLSETKCFCFDNLSGKVKGLAYWITDNSLTFCNSATDILLDKNDDFEQKFGLDDFQVIGEKLSEWNKK